MPPMRDRQTMYSPHTRGWSLHEPVNQAEKKVFPAHAGVVPRQGDATVASRCIPRTRGGGPGEPKKEERLSRYSPHTRGWSPLICAWCGEDIVFPAHAGVVPVGLMAAISLT